MESRAKDFSYTTDQDSSISHKCKIDAGGYGDVHEMYNLMSGRFIARKLLHLPNSKNGPNVIRNEARAVKKLCNGTHPNLIRVFAMGELCHSPYYFIDMELCDLSLQAYLYPHSSTSTTGLGLPPFLKDLPSSLLALHIWNIMKQIANGLKFIHERSEVHRDLKPSNVLYSRKASLWKLTDFGLTSEATANQLNSTTSARGSPGYRAPELGLHNKYGSQVDIWSMGCLLHELATGKQAFFSDVAVVTHYLQNSNFLVSLDDKFDDTSKECISDAISRMLQKEPSERPSAATLYDEFCGHFVSGTPAVLINGQRADSEDAQKSTTDKGKLNSVLPRVENLSPIEEEDTLANTSMAQNLGGEWSDCGVIEEQMKEINITPKIEPEQISRSLALNESPHIPPDSSSVVFPDIPRHVVSTYDSSLPPAMLGSIPPDLWSPVSSVNSPHSPSDFLRPVSSTNPSRQTLVKFVAGLPSPVSSASSPQSPPDLRSVLSSSHFSSTPSTVKSPPPDLPTPVSPTNSPHMVSDISKPVSPIEGPYKPSSPTQSGLHDLPNIVPYNSYPYTTAELAIPVAYNSNIYTRPPRIPAVQRQGPPPLITDLNPQVGNRTQEGYVDQGEPYRLSLPRAPIEFTNFPSQDFSPTELAAAYSATREDNPPFSPLRQIKKLFKRKDSPRQSSPTLVSWHDDDPSERALPLLYPEMPGSPRPSPDEYITLSGRTQEFR